MRSARPAGRVAASVALGALLYGCATPDDALTIRWVKVPLAQIDRACQGALGHKRPFPAWGCYVRSGNACVVYTATVAEDRRIHDTLGHEVRHCFEGAFH